MQNIINIATKHNSELIWDGGVAWQHLQRNGVRNRNTLLIWLHLPALSTLTMVQFSRVWSHCSVFTALRLQRSWLNFIQGSLRCSSTKAAPRFTRMEYQVRWSNRIVIISVALHMHRLANFEMHWWQSFRLCKHCCCLRRWLASWYIANFNVSGVLLGSRFVSDRLILDGLHQPTAWICALRGVDSIMSAKLTYLVTVKALMVVLARQLSYIQCFVGNGGVHKVDIQFSTCILVDSLAVFLV